MYLNKNPKRSFYYTATLSNHFCRAFGMGMLSIEQTEFLICPGPDF